MKSKLIILLIFCYPGINLAQEKDFPLLNFSHNPQDSILYLEIQNIQKNLGAYHLERQRAYTCALFSFATAVMGSIVLQFNSDGEIGAYVAYGLSAFSAIGSAVLFFDAEKWLKKASH